MREKKRYDLDINTICAKFERDGSLEMCLALFHLTSGDAFSWPISASICF